MKPLYALRELEKSYGSDPALRIDRLDLFAGQNYCLVGPNGAGKSTLLRLLALLDWPSAGQLLIETEDRVRKLIDAADASPPDDEPQPESASQEGAG